MRLYLRLMRTNMNKKTKTKNSNYKVIQERKDNDKSSISSFLYYLLCCFYPHTDEEIQDHNSASNSSIDVINMQNNSNENEHNEDIIKNIILSQDNFVEQYIHDFDEETKEENNQVYIRQINNDKSKTNYNENSDCSFEELVL